MFCGEICLPKDEILRVLLTSGDRFRGAGRWMARKARRLQIFDKMINFDFATLRKKVALYGFGCDVVSRKP